MKNENLYKIIEEKDNLIDRLQKENKKLKEDVNKMLDDIQEYESILHTKVNKIEKVKDENKEEKDTNIDN